MDKQFHPPEAAKKPPASNLSFPGDSDTPSEEAASPEQKRRWPAWLGRFGRRQHLEKDYEVIVVGGGGSGLAAAVSAAENGARVLVLEKNPALGGTTGIATGSFTANRTSLQHRSGIHDDLDAHCVDAGKFAAPEIEARNNADLRRFFLSHGGETIEWLLGMGISFFGPSPEPNNRVPRMHNVIPNAMAYVATFRARLAQLRGTVLCNAPVTALWRERGAVVGVVARIDGQPARLRASRGVVLATGDYPSSPEILCKYKGSEYANLEGINKTATGEGHLLAESVGAKLVNMDLAYGPEIRFIPMERKSLLQRLPTQGPLASLMGRLVPYVPKLLLNAVIKRMLVTWQHPEDALLSDGAILVNSAGRRIANETAWPDRELAIAAQPDKICFILLDQRLVERYNAWPHYVSTAPEIAYAYVDDYLRLRPDVAIAATDLETLAARRNIPAEALRQTVARYNRHATNGSADPFGRQGRLRPLDGKRWVLLGPAKAYFTTTAGGTAVNERLQVLDHADRPIAGLYAAGLVGVGGQVLWGHGLNIGWALTSGRLVGRTVAQASTAPRSTDIRIDEEGPLAAPSPPSKSSAKT